MVAAFRHLQSDSHIGKVVVNMGAPESDMESNIGTMAKMRRISFDPDASYLLAGGVGGLGRAIATWMVERGARHLTFLSRSAGNGVASTVLFDELMSMGCTVTAVAGRVDDINDVHRAVDESKSPIKGVLQLSMVLKAS